MTQTSIFTFSLLGFQCDNSAAFLDDMPERKPLGKEGVLPHNTWAFFAEIATLARLLSSSSLCFEWAG